MNSTKFLSTKHLLLILTISYASLFSNDSPKKPFIECIKIHEHSTKEPYWDEIEIYKVKPIGFPHNTSFKIFAKLYPSTSYDETPHPLLGSRRENDQIDELFWIAERMIPGQTITFRFKSTDGKHHEYVELTPFPLIFQSDNARVQVKARLLSASPTMYDLELSGIDSEETFIFSSVSGNETLRDVLEGATYIGYHPDVIGSKGGIAKLSFKFADGEIKFQLPVGNEIKNHAQMQLEKGISFKTGLPLSEKAKNYLSQSCSDHETSRD